jgi:hypothetical protein
MAKIVDCIKEYRLWRTVWNGLNQRKSNEPTFVEKCAQILEKSYDKMVNASKAWPAKAQHRTAQ